MSQKPIKEKQSAPWMTSALLVPLIHTAAGSSWAVTALAGGACLAIRWWIAVCVPEPGRGLRVCQGIWGWVLISQVMRWSAAYWSGVSIVPLILLVLAVWCTGIPERAARVGCVLLYPLVLLLGAVLVSGLPEVRGDFLKPEWELPAGALLSVLLVPTLGGSNGRRCGRYIWLLLLFGLSASVITPGVLSPAIAARHPTPIGELSKSLSLLGVAERFESLTAAAMTMGFFSAMCYLLSIADEKKSAASWIGGAAAAGLFLLDWEADPGLMAVGSALFWVILPVVWGLTKNLKKYEKTS